MQLNGRLGVSEHPPNHQFQVLKIDLCCYRRPNYFSRLAPVSLNIIKSTFEEIISGVPQGSIAGPILFIIFFNEFFSFILVAAARNFADDNTLSSFTQTIENLISILESESEIAICWFKY